MTQVKLWQIVSQTANAIIFSDADGNLKSLPAGTAKQVLIAGPDGAPVWADNEALAAALQAKTDAASAIATAKAYTEAQIAALVDNAPIALDTLNELAVKLNGEDSAINALLLQVDGKADKTEVTAHIAQAKQDAIQSAQGYTDNAIGNVQSNMDSLVAGIRGDLQSYADQTASFKAENAKVEAIGTAAGYTDQAVSALAASASDDAAAKADGAKSAAVSEANTYTDGAINSLANSLSGEAQGLADAAKDAAISAAAGDAASKVAGLQDSIPAMFWTEGTSTACFVGNADNLDKGQALGAGLVVSQNLTEVTGAGVVANDPTLNPKLLFVNGVAMSEEWSANRIGNNQLAIRFSQKLADHVFDGTKNSVMLLAEYRSYNAISRIS